MPLSFVTNLRDLGDKPAQGGRLTRRGRLFRAGNLTNLDRAGARLVVERLGLEAYYDLRIDREIDDEGRPDALIDAGVAWRRLPIDSYDPGFQRHSHPSCDHWIDLYVVVFERNAGAFVSLLRAAAEARAPLLFGCSAGKDRTGIGAALLLRCLGVGDEAILADYARTTADIAPHIDRFARHFDRPGRSREAFVAHYLTASPEILAGFLAAIDRRFGGHEAALRDAGLEPEALDALRQRYLVDAA